MSARGIAVMGVLVFFGCVALVSCEAVTHLWQINVI